MHYFYGVIMILFIVTVPSCLYFLYAVELRRQEVIEYYRTNEHCNIYLTYQQTYAEATMNWKNIKATFFGQPFGAGKERRKEEDIIDVIFKKAERINKRITVTIIGGLREYQKSVPEYAPDHLLLYAMAHLLENELHYYTAHDHNHLISNFIDTNGLVNDELPEYVLSSITDKEVTSRIKAIVRNAMHDSMCDGFPYENVVINTILTLARAMTPKKD